MKKMISVICALSLICIFTMNFAFAADEEGRITTEQDSALEEMNSYKEVPVLTAENNVNAPIEKYRSEEESQANVQIAKNGVLALNLDDIGLSYIEDACLAELEEISQDEDCVLNEYTVLVPKGEAKAAPSLYATYQGRDYYTTVTSKSNITLQKNKSFGSSSNLKKWSKNAISLALCFSKVTKANIAWSLVSAVLPSKYTVHTSDWTDAYITLNPTNRAIFVKNSTGYVNVVNREYGPVRPYLVYHYNNATSSSPTKTVYSKYTTYPDATGSSKTALLYNAKAVYDSGANALSFTMRNIVDLLWE